MQAAFGSRPSLPGGEGAPSPRTLPSTGAATTPLVESPVASVPDLLHRSIAGWRSDAAERFELQGGLDAEAASTLFRLGAFIVHSCGEARERERRPVAEDAASAAEKRQAADERARRLLPFLAWLPMRVFSQPTMAAALETWQWVSASCPHLRLALLGQVVAAWRWSIDMHFGLFSGGTHSTEPAGRAAPASATGTPAMPADFISPPEPAGLAERVARMTVAGATTHAPPQCLPAGLTDHEPHRLVLQFFEERCRQSRSSSGEELALVAQAVSAAVADGTRLSTQPAAFGARVRLVHLGMCVLQAAHPSPEHAARGAAVPPGSSRRGSALPHLADPLPVLTGGSSPTTAVPRLGGLAGGSFSAAPGAPAAAGPGDDDGLWDDATTVSGSLHGAAAGAAPAAEPPAVDAPAPPEIFSGDRWPGVSVGSLAVLRERLYRAALSWFALPLSRYEVATSPQVVRQDFPYIVSMCRLVQLDVRLWSSSGGSGGSSGAASVFAAGGRPGAAPLTSGSLDTIDSNAGTGTLRGASWAESSSSLLSPAGLSSQRSQSGGSGPAPATPSPASSSYAGKSSAPDLRRMVLLRLATGVAGTPRTAANASIGRRESSRWPRRSREPQPTRAGDSARNAAAVVASGWLAQVHAAQGGGLRGLADLILVRESAR